jgi:hypothetical protein
LKKISFSWYSDRGISGRLSGVGGWAVNPSSRLANRHHYIGFYQY